MESFGRKLFTFKDAEGKEQFEAVEFAGKFLDDLKAKDPRVTAMSVVGSTGKGYALSESSDNKQGNSDLDVCLIYEDSKGTRKNRLLPDDPEKKLKYKGKFDVHPVSEINMTKISQKSLLSDPASAIGGLVFPTLGDVSKINGYYDSIRNKIAKLSDAEKEDWVASFVQGVMANEFVCDRIERKRLTLEGERYAETFHRVLEEREILYEKRIRELFVNEK